jgi:hypothetical protein
MKLHNLLYLIEAFKSLFPLLNYINNGFSNSIIQLTKLADLSEVRRKNLFFISGKWKLIYENKN